MVSLIEMFGGSAGRIWRILNEYGPNPEKKLKKKTDLKKEIFYGAVGWLARENKIKKEGRTYLLGETNLVPEIGRRAGRVWKTLDIWGELSLPELAKLTDMNDRELFEALGWLAREDKVESYDLKIWRLKNLDRKY